MVPQCDGWSIIAKLTMFVIDGPEEAGLMVPACGAPVLVETGHPTEPSQMAEWWPRGMACGEITWDFLSWDGRRNRPVPVASGWQDRLMTVDPLLEQAQGVWETLAAALVSFPPPGGLNVVTSPASQVALPPWAGIVVLGDSAIITAPTDRAAQVLRRGLAGMPVSSLTSPEAVAAVLPVHEVLGPAALGYVCRDGFRPVPAGRAVERLAPGHQDLTALVKSVPPEDAGESAMDEITSAAFVVREGPDVVAAAGFQAWPAAVAHLCVLTAPGERGRGLARQVASAAVAQALADGLLPQWRARTTASRSVARALGFRELGSQLSLRLGQEELHRKG
ncbi:GNAT family N-acetyltransferase [Streptomyces sp. NPDC045369]|uniref:GNAT family N-acetyltransferase n=1 Tax=Streptomyces sp. NPDC045369 TaxID=3155732 RepID=UPI0033F35E7D